MYYLCNENKGADQLLGYRAADLRLCFRIYAKSRFSHDAAQLVSLYHRKHLRKRETNYVKKSLYYLNKFCITISNICNMITNSNIVMLLYMTYVTCTRYETARVQQTK